MFSVAVATVLFPTLSRLATSADLDGFRRTVSGAIRLIAFLLFPASIVCAVLAEPIVRVVYQRGDFTPAQTPATAHALAAFSLGLAFNGFMLMLNRAFFSLQSPWIPTWVALANLGLNAVLDAAFYSLGIWGLPLSTSIVNIAGSTALFILLRRRLRRLELRETTRSVARVAAACIPLTIVSYGVWRLFDVSLRGSFLAALFALLVALAAGVVTYGISCRLLGVRELETLLSLRSRAQRG
jgi:putative peptidoglycan lipid II flippase